MKFIFLCEAVFPENKGGVERWFKKLSRELADRGHHVTYLNASGVNEVRDGVTYRSITKESWYYLPGGVRSKRQALTFAWKSLVALLRSDAEVVYATSVPILSVLPVGVLKLLRRRTKTIIEWFEIWPLKYWIEYSGLVSGILGWLVQLVALQIGTFRVAYTGRAVKQLSSVSLVSNRTNILHLPGLCEPSFSSPPDATTLRNDVVFLGRFVDEKQPLLAIDSVIEFIKIGWQGNFWLLGKGPAVDLMKARIDTFSGFAHQIHVVENPPDDVVRGHILESFVLLHPSKREGYGLASVEAAYCGTPSILLDYPNNATIDLGISPSLVVFDVNPEKIAEKLRFAYENQAQVRLETLDWAAKASHAHSSRATVDYLEEIIGGK